MEQAYTIARFFPDFGDTNAVIIEAMRLAESDADQLEDEAASLLSAIAEYEGADKANICILRSTLVKQVSSPVQMCQPIQLNGRIV